MEFDDRITLMWPSSHVHDIPRLQGEIETTGTFKYRKLDLVAEGFDPDRIKGPLYYRNHQKGYLKITKPAYDKILSGEQRL